MVNEKNAYRQTKQELNNLQNQLIKEKQDHQATKTAQRTAEQNRDDYHHQLTQLEQKIVQQLNQSLKLNLAKNEKDLNKAIVVIQKLINKDPLIQNVEIDDATLQEQLNQTQQTVLHLEKQLQEKNTPFGEDLAVIKQLELTSLEELFKQAVDSAVIQQIQQATNYQQVVTARQAFLQKQLGQKEENIVPAIVTKNELVQPPNKERMVLISLLVGSLIGMGGLLMKLRNKNKKA